MSLASLDNLRTEVVGRRGALLGLAVQTTFLTVVTLGLYSFWSRTRIRRWLWSSLEIGGAPLEYRGRPLEKLMGFVIAACIVGAYLGIVVMVLIFLSLTFFNNVVGGIAASVVLILPVYWFARYRGLRYLLNHTEWRGLSFSMDPGAWGYAWRACGWTLLTLVSLGFALPWRTQRLWKYRVDRTYFGDGSFRLTDDARSLVRLWLPKWLILLLLGGAWTAAIASFEGPVPLDEGPAILIILIAPILSAWVWIRWRVHSYAELVAAIRWGDDVRLSVAPRVGRIVGIHLGGWLLVGLMLFAALIGAGIAYGIVAVSTLDLETLEQSLTGGDSLSPYILFGAGLLFYLAIFLLRGTFRLAFVTFPLIRHVGETLAVSGAAEIGAAQQGTRRHMADADGFANLFDLGAGI